jgi:hypothetical protein
MHGEATVNNQKGPPSSTTRRASCIDVVGQPHTIRHGTGLYNLTADGPQSQSYNRTIDNEGDRLFGQCFATATAAATAGAAADAAGAAAEATTDAVGAAAADVAGGAAKISPSARGSHLSPGIQ